MIMLIYQRVFVAKFPAISSLEPPPCHLNMIVIIAATPSSSHTWHCPKKKQTNARFLVIADMYIYIILFCALSETAEVWVKVGCKKTRCLPTNGCTSSQMVPIVPNSRCQSMNHGHIDSDILPMTDPWCWYIC